MQSFAELLLTARTEGLLKGKKALEDTTKAGGDTEKAVKGTAKGFEGAGKSASTATPQVRGFGDATGAASGAALKMTKALGGLAAGLFSVQTATAAITAAKSLDMALSETATLLTGIPGEIDKVAASARGLADAYGTSDEQQVRAFYQAISGGAGSASEATELLDAANKLAIGGITDVASATGILTTAVNVYKAEGQSAADASDALFVAMKAGVTTIPELASALGAVLPYSQSLGVSFDETAAAVSALTKGGLTTAVATTGLRAALNSILAPTEQAKDLANDLSLEFNAAGLEAMGLAGFLQAVNEATGGSNVLLQQLFGSTEATAVALGFAGAAGQSFTEILAQMNAKLGATEEAMSAVDASASDRMDDALQAMGNTLTRMGSMVLPALATALEGAASLMALVADNSDALAIALGILAVRQIPAVIGGLVTLSAWLATSEGLFIAGAIAAKGMALAMNLIPFVAVVAGATATYRAFSNNQQAAETLKTALQGVVDTQVGLNTATENYYTNVTRGNLEAMTSQAKAAQDALSMAVDAAQARVAAAETAAKFGVGGYNLPVLIAELEGLQVQLFNAETRLSAADHAVENFGSTAAGTAEAVEVLTASSGKYTASTFAAIPAMSDLIAKYGTMAISVRDLMQAQNDLATADAMAGLTGLVDGAVKVAAGLDMSAESATTLYLALYDITAADGLNEQAKAAAQVAREIYNASGGLEGMDAPTRAVYQSLLNAARSAADVAANASAASSNIGGAAGEAARLAQNLSAAASALAGVISATANLNVGAIGLEAQNRALESGNTLIQARTAGMVAAKKAELASALGSGDGVIRAAATVELNNYTAAVERSSSAQEVNEQLTKAMTASLGSGGGGGGGGLSKATKDASKEIDKMADEIERLEFDADPLKKYNAEIEKLDRLVGAGLSDGAYQKAVADINEEFANSNPTIASMGDAIGDFVASGLRDFGSLLDSFKNMIKQMIATAIANPIKLALTTAFSGGGTAAAAGVPGGGILGAGGALGGLGGIGSALAGGFMNSVGGFLGGGLSGGFGAIGAQVGTAFATGTGTAIAGAIGAIAAPLLAVAAVFSFFKSKTKELDAGLRVTIDGMDTLVETFSTIEKKKFWGLSKKVSTSFQAAEDSVADPFEAIVAQMQGNVLAAAGSLGVGSDAFASFAHEVQLSTKGMSEEDAQRAVSEALQGIGDAFAALTPGLEAFARDGEEAGATLSRLAGDLSAVNLIMDTLGHTLQEVSVIGAGTASDFAALFGGIEAMNAATTAFFTAFYTDAERFATAQRQIGAQFGALNIAMPQSRAEFRRMVDALDLTTVGGRETYAALVSLSGALDAVLPSVANFTAQIAEMAGSITTQIDQIIGDTSNAMRANEQAAALWYRTASTLRAFIADMRGTAGALISAQQARAFSEMRFQTLLASAIGGDNEAAGDLTAAARTLLDNTKATATSALEVARAESRVLSDLQLVSGVSDVEGARHDVIAGLLGQQVDLLGVVRDAINNGDPLSPSDIDGLNGQLGALEGAIKAAEMINYAFLKERLSVTVDLLATADLPADVRRLIANAQDGITGQIDFLVRADLTPDQKWLALTGVSEHIKTVKFLAQNTLAPDLVAMALASSSAISRTINLVAGSALAPDVMRVALAGSSELARVVNVTLASSADAQAMKLALANLGAYAVAVSAAMAPSVSSDVRQIVFGDAGSFAVQVTAALSINGTHRRILLEQQGDYAVNVTAALAADIPPTVQRLLLNANTQAVRALTIAAVYASDLTPAEIEILNTEGTTALRTIQAMVNPAGIDATGMMLLRQLSLGKSSVQRDIASIFSGTTLSAMGTALLAQLSEGTGRITRTIDGVVNTSSLTAPQLALLNAISGASSGTINLGGSYTFDPSTGFATLMAEQTASQASLVAPMDGLRSSLDGLRLAIVADQASAVLSAGTFKDHKWLEFGVEYQGIFDVSASQLAQLAQMSGVALRSTSGAIKTSDIVRRETEAALRAIGSLGALERIGRNFDLSSEYWSGAVSVPGFASGGMHMGGLRMVGENGPELEATGAARIYSATQTRAMMGGNTEKLEELVVKLTEEVARMRDENTQLVKNGNADLRRVRLIEERREAEAQA